jgi:peroxiredoxin
LPLLEEAYAKLKAQGLEVVAVAVDETVDDVKKFLADSKLSFTVLWLDGSTPEGKKVSADYGVTAIPRTLCIAPDWVIKSDTTGLHEKADIYKALASIGLKTD